MPKNPIYTTFLPGELEKELKALACKTGPVNDAPEGWTTRRRHRFHLRNYDCSVTFPDGTQGICQYTRQGPR